LGWYVRLDIGPLAFETRIDAAVAGRAKYIEGAPQRSRVTAAASGPATSGSRESVTRGGIRRPVGKTAVL
jgi:hypothetical protein